MAIEGFETGINRKFKLGPDLVEECMAVIKMPDPANHAPHGDQSDWQPIFEPHDFNEQH